MGIQHEGSDGAFQFRQIAFQIHEPRAGDLGGAFEIHLAQGFADLEMLLGGIDARWRAKGAFRHRHIGALVRAIGHVIGRQVGKNGEKIAHFLL